MGNYTTELRFICETLAGQDESVGYNSVNNVISKARPQIFNFAYPIFDKAYKETLETKIIKHYYTREICAETYARWKLFLDTRMNEIMPRYNKLYESELLQFNPLYDADYTKSGDRKVVGMVDDNETKSTNMTSLQTDNRTSTQTLSGKDTETISTELDGQDVITGSDRLSGSDRTQSTDTLSGTDRSNTTDTLSGNDTVRTTDTLSGSDVTTTESEAGGSDTTERENEPINDQWTYYNDTPQGGVNGMTLGNNTYLTNATHVTETGAGSHDQSTTDYGRTDDTTETTNYGKVDTINNTTTYGKVDTTNESTTYGKVDTIDSTTTYGKVDNRTTTTDYGKTSDTTDETKYGKITTDKDTGTTKNETDGTVTSNRDTDTTTNEDYAEHVIGKFPGKSYSKLLQEFRETFLNIDLMVINELSDLFFGLWE